MCNPFSCIVDKKGKVYWQLGIDAHDGLIEKFKLKEPAGTTNKEIADKLDWCKVEITPDNYLTPTSWKLIVDERITPTWFKKRQAFYEQKCFIARDEWLSELNKIFNRNEALHPINPLKIKAGKVDDKVKQLLKMWDSVWASVWASVRDSVGASVWASVWASVGASVGDSVRASVGAYFGSLFKLKRSKWMYTSKIKAKGYPFEPAVKLWKLGFVASFDGNIWRLHSGPKATIVFQITKAELNGGKHGI
jgi:hypothetical protein